MAENWVEMAENLGRDSQSHQRAAAAHAWDHAVTGIGVLYPYRPLKKMY